MSGEACRELNKCKSTLKDNARQWREAGVSTVTIVSAFAESMAEISVELVGPKPTSHMLQYLDLKIQEIA